MGRSGEGERSNRQGRKNEALVINQLGEVNRLLVPFCSAHSYTSKVWWGGSGERKDEGVS